MRRERILSGEGLESREQLDARRLRRGLFLLIVVGLLSRLLAVPLATIDGGDPVTKIRIAQTWLSHPSFITEGVWGPLHTYLLALPLSLFSDPVMPPVILHLLFGVATVVPLVFLTRIAFRSVPAALFTGGVYLFYPVAFSNSLLVSSEAPFIFFLALSLLGLARAREPDGRAAHAVGAGVALTLASMLRYEAWMLIPLLGILLWTKPRFMVWFIACASLHPILWMAGNAVAHGDLLYSIHAASGFETLQRQAEGGLGLRGRAYRFLFQPLMTFFGLTPVLGGFVAAGVVVALRERREHALWLVPPLILLVLLSVGSAQGSLALKAKYTVTVGTLLLPFAALLHDRFRLHDFRIRGFRVPVTLLTIVLMLGFSHPAISPIRPGYGFRSISLIPGFAGDRDARAIGEQVRAELDASDETLGFMTDGFPRVASFYILWLTRRDMEGAYRPKPTHMGSLPEESSEAFNELLDFLERRPAGLFLFHRGSSFTDALGLAASDTAMLGELRLTVDNLRRFEYGDVDLQLARYRATYDSER